jgi:hypothetical protein
LAQGSSAPNANAAAHKMMMVFSMFPSYSARRLAIQPGKRYY